MITLKKILVPTDFSDHSAKAMQYGAELAAKFGAELHLLHSFETTRLMYGEGAYYPPETESELEAVAVKKLDDLKLEVTAIRPLIRRLLARQAWKSRHSRQTGSSRRDRSRNSRVKIK